MAIIFQKKEKQQKKLILIFIFLILVAGAAIWWGFFRKEIEIPYEEMFIPAERPIINFEVLRLPILEKLEPFPEIELFEQKIGRKNPFVIFGDIILENQETIPEDIIFEDIVTE